MSSMHEAGALRVYLAVAPLYVSFGLCLGLIQVALPTVLQRNGLPVEQAGYLALLFLPFGLSALWAPLVDKIRIFGLERRLGWVLLSQGVVVASLAAIAFSGPQRLGLLAPMLAVLAFAAATMDVTLDGYLSETSTDGGLALRGGLKVSCMYAGTIAGAMLSLALFERLGWMLVVLGATLACALALAAFAVFFAPAPAVATRRGAGFRRFLVERGMAGRVAMVASVGVMLGAGVSAPRLLYVERGATLENVGLLFGPLSMVLGLAGALAGMWLGERRGIAGTLLSSGLLFAAGMVPMSLAPDMVFGGFAGMAVAIGAAAIAYGAAYGGVSALALGWTSREGAATDYSIVQSVWTTSIIVGGGMAGLLLARIGTPLFILAGFAISLLLWLLAHREPVRAHEGALSL